jgi:hypothetical protein
MTNRLTPYEAGWLTSLVKWEIATEADAREAMNRVAQAAVEELTARRKLARRLKKKRRNDD